MATGDPDRLVFSGAQLCHTPTDLLATGGFPWGGTALGLAKTVVAKARRKVRIFAEESLGGMPFSGIDSGEAWIITGHFRGFDTDVVQRIFASTATGASTGLRQVIYPNGNTFRAGGLISDLGIKLLISPDDYESERFLYAYNAVPLTPEDGGLPLQRGEELLMPFEFICLPDASNRTVVWGLREDVNSIL